MAKADAVEIATRVGATEQAKNLDRLLIVNNWAGSLGLILFWIVVSFLLLGYWIPYWRFADMDIMMVYQGFLLNDGKPQEFKAGDTFVELPTNVHRVSMNPSADTPAKFLVTFLCDKDTPLTVPER